MSGVLQLPRRRNTIASMDTVSYRLPEELIGDVDRIAERRGVTRSDIVREALAEYVGRAREAPRSRLEILDEILADEPGTGVSDLAERAEEYLRESFASGRHPVALPSRSRRKAAGRPRKSSRK